MSFGYQVLGFGSFPNRGGYTIENAVWFSSSADTLTKSFSEAGDTQKAVISFWIKQSSAGANNKVFSSSGADALNFLFNTDDEVRIRWNNDHSFTTVFLSDGQFRDYTAWQHFALAIDMTQATDTNRIKLYVNGVESTVKSTSYPAQSATFTWNTAIEHVIHGAGEAEFYLAEFISLDGQSIVGGDLAITDLVDTDSNGVPVPVDPSGLTFGTNGFWLDFAIAPGTGAGSGNDVSGNNNDFTETSMTAAQQVTDTCTDDAANDIGNYTTWNPLDFASNNGVFSEGNTVRVQASGGGGTRSTIAATSGRYYIEVELTAWSSGSTTIGIRPTTQSSSSYWGIGIDTSSGDTLLDNVVQNNGAALSQGNIIGFDCDFDNDQVSIYINNSIRGSAITFTSGTRPSDGLPHSLCVSDSGNTLTVTVQARPETWTYSAKGSGVALSTANLPAPTVKNPSDYFQAALTTHGGTSETVTCNWNMDATNTLIISKNSDTSEKWFVSNGAAGETKHMNFALTTASATDSNVHSVVGTTLTMGSAFAADDYMTYFIKAGATSGVGINSGVIHENESSTNVAHGLGATPVAGWAKRTDSAGGWYVFTPGMGSQTARHLFLDTIVSEQTVADVWGTHSETNTVLGAGASGLADGTYDVVSFTPIAGFSKFTSYTGTGAAATGPYVELGFRAKFFIIKGITVSGSWTTHDTVRNAYNPSNSVFYFDAPNASGSDGDIDVTANGLKISAGAGNVNTSAKVYAVWAFAEHPFGGSGVAQAKAR
jgi:hypothetical protein